MVKRSALLTLAAGGLAAVSAATALARGGGWQPILNTAGDAACGATVVHLYPVATKEFARTTATLPDGTVVVQVSGSLKWQLTTDAGATMIVNSSGPGLTLFYPDGRFEIVGKGESLFTFTDQQAAALGVPQITLSKGPADLVWHPDGTVSGHVGPVARDICAQLGVS